MGAKAQSSALIQKLGGVTTVRKTDVLWTGVKQVPLLEYGDRSGAAVRWRLENGKFKRRFGDQSLGSIFP